MSHPNSKTVTIFRTGSFLARSQSKDIEDYFADSKVSIGSFWESDTSPKPATGLEYREIDLLLPHLVDADPEDRDFRKKVSDYYTDLDVKLPYKGLVLEIGLENGGTEVSAKNMPLNLSDYVRYRVIKKHPHMAQSKDQADSNPVYQYYIFDKDAVVDKSRIAEGIKNQALKNYFSIEQEPDKIRQMLLLMGTDPREFGGKNVDADQSSALRKLAETKPVLFNQIFEQEDMTIRYWITAMLKSKVLNMAGTIIRMSTGNKTIIGKNMEEAISFFLDDDNDDTISLLKAQQQEADKELPKQGVRMTKKLNEI